MIERLTERAGGIFQGPWYELRLPFQKAAAGEAGKYFSLLEFPYTPHKHQAEAFARLCGDEPRSTLVATGTGSGKTECFLYPILEHCARARSRGESGIKAVILYPMNALANDQARRFAEIVCGSDALKGVRVGMYIGGESENCTTMSAESVITDRETMRGNPPDILLTNYKMLDYLLVRTKDRELWERNTPKTLRYLVVDELHTFDGAQATDLACLIRRLKERLHSPQDYLRCVGTSATLGGESDIKDLLDYAQKVFGEKFDEDSTVRETCMTPQEFLLGAETKFFCVPGAENVASLNWDGGQDLDEWLKIQYRLWFGDEADAPDFSTREGLFALGEKIRQHRFFSELLKTYANSKTWILEEKELAESVVGLCGRPETREVFGAILCSFLALCARARRCDSESGRQEPFVRLSAHLWMREMSAMMCPTKPSENGKLELCFDADMSAEQKKNALPLVYCMDCGRMSWGGIAEGEKINPSREKFTSAWFGDGRDARLLTPLTPEERASGDLFKEKLLCPHCMRLFVRNPDGSDDDKPCQHCGYEKMIRVVEEDEDAWKPSGKKNRKECPCCKSRDGLMIVGSRAASMNSSAIGTMFASTCNDDKKLLTFSDSVQDASHRAGFFKGRAYHSTLRIAFCRALREMSASANANGGALTLKDACERVAEFWRERKTPEDFVATFMPPDKEWLTSYEELKESGKLPADSELFGIVSERLNWELYTDLSWRSRRGRTLERAGCFILKPDLEVMADAVRDLREHVAEKDSYAFSEKDLMQWLAGFVHWLRVHGAIITPMLECYAETGRDFAFNQRFKKSIKGMAPNFCPQMLTTEQKKNNGFLVAWTDKGAETWLENWTLKMPWRGAHGKLTTHDFLRLALSILREKKLLLAKEKKYGDCNLGLNPESLKISDKVCVARCRECGHVVPIPAEMAEIYSGMPCLRKGCGGRLIPEEIPENASRRIYETGAPARVRATEHTGLLERKTREKIEEQFINQSGATPPNLLSCTPTLEMGVDIGNLSGVFLCSVPPSVASFRQRVGRAGRRDGNAFTLTTANNQINDLYFFAAPENMICGQVKTPGVFLKAPAILERQLFAFCLDQWVERQEKNAVIPRFLGKPDKEEKKPGVLDLLENENEKKDENEKAFPRNLFHFMEEREDEILSKFFSMMGDELDNEIKNELTIKLKGGEETEGSLAYRVASCFKRTHDEREDYRKKLNEHRTARKKLEKEQAEHGLSEAEQKELDALYEACEGMNGLINEINGKETLGFLTDEGLLPNYAFPEEGVTLHSVILKKSESADGKKKSAYSSVSADYVRAGSTAITEFAPGNTFYVAGQKVKIDQINLATSEEEEWVFCPKCAHMERRIGENSPRQCPRCNADWSDVAQRRPMIRLNQVIATSSARSAISLDDSDRREKSFLGKHMSVCIPVGNDGRENERKVWALDDDRLTFAFEYVQQAIFREISTGDRFAEGNDLATNGKGVPAPGFEICDKCGKLMTPTNEGKARHDLSCPYRKKPEEEKRKKSLLLYRELKSEAVRILLPNSAENSATVREAFVSALVLGLKEYFKGDIGHLQICDDSIRIGEPPKDRAFPCLVVYDCVPGGTGYLKELCHDPKTLLEVLKLSFDKMKECECRHDPDKDGCHLCLLSTRSRKNTSPSRRIAMSLLRGILESGGTFKEQPGIDSVNIDPLVESELENKFLEYLKEKYLVKKHLVEGAPGYLLTAKSEEDAKDGGKSMIWEIRLQKEIKAQNPKETTIPDFLFTPLKKRDSKPIAVFLDGKTWHAGEDVNRMSGDLRKRESLRRNKDFIVWTLTWHDVVPDKNDEKSLPQLPLNEKRLEGVRNVVPERKSEIMPWLSPEKDKRNPLWQLDRLLRNGSEKLMKDWQTAAGLLALSFEQPQMRCSEPLFRLREFIEKGISDDSVKLEQKGGEKMCASVREDEMWRMLSMIPLDKCNAKSFEEVVCRISFDSDKLTGDDSSTEQWRAFWHLYNVLQALPDFRATTPELGRDGYRYETALDATGAEILLREDLEDLENPELAEFICGLQICASDKPETLYEAEDERGEIIGTAEVAWVARKIALLRNDAACDAEAFSKQGWKVLMWSESEKDELARKLNDLLSKS